MNEIGEGPLSVEESQYAMSLPGTPDAPMITSSVQSGTFTATINVDWTPLMDTGGVPLTGYKLYMTRVSTNAQTLAYDGTDQP